MRLFALTLIVFSPIFFTLVEASTAWRLDKEEDGIKVYLRDIPGTALKSFKGTMTVNRRLTSILAVIEDIASYPRWLHNCRSAKTMKRIGDKQLVSYVVTDMPWPVADRDAVVTATQTQNKENKRIEIKLLAEPNLGAEVAGKVRIKKMQGRWLLTPIEKDKVNIIYEMNIDPGGNIPKWLVNSMLVDLPFYTLTNLRRISKEDKYANVKINGIID